MLLPSRTPLYQWHAEHGARFLESDGWELPAVYSNVATEMSAGRERVGVADVSAWAKISLQGSDVAAVTLALLGDGGAAQPLDVVSFAVDTEVLACRLTWDHLLLLATTPNPARLQERLEQLPRLASVVQTDVSSLYAAFCLVGPKTEDLLGRLTSLAIGPSALPAGSCAETGLAGIQVLLIRPPQAVVPALFLLPSWDLAEYVWDTLLQSGRDLGVIPMGCESLQPFLAGAGGQLLK
jgi:sarcosine oxidase subunit alpha